MLQATPFSFSRHSQQSNLFFLAAFYQLCTAVAQLTATAPLTRKKGYGCFFFIFTEREKKQLKMPRRPLPNGGPFRAGVGQAAMSTATAVSCVSPKGCAVTLAPRRHGRRMRGGAAADGGLGGARRTAPPASQPPRAPDGWLRQPDAQSGQTVLRGALGSFPVRPRRPNLRTAGLSFLLWNPSIGVYVHSMKTSKKTVDPSSVLIEY